MSDWADLHLLKIIFSAINTQLESLNAEYQEYVDAAKTLEHQRQVLEEDKFDADTKLDNERSRLNEKERELEVKMKEFEKEKDHEVALMGDR